MNLHQLAAVKQWHLSHPLGHEVEHQVWDGLLAVWVAGWTGLPAAWFMQSMAVLALCGALVCCCPAATWRYASACTGAASCAATGWAAPGHPKAERLQPGGPAGATEAARLPGSATAPLLPLTAAALWPLA